MQCPCKGCKRRDPDCHGRCADYICWKEKIEEARAKKNAMWDLKDFFTKPRYRGRRKPRV